MVNSEILQFLHLNTPQGGGAISLWGKGGIGGKNCSCSVLYKFYQSKEKQVDSWFGLFYKKKEKKKMLIINLLNDWRMLVTSEVLFDIAGA